jgi:hypothetical protein
LIEEGCDGQAEGVGVGSDGSAGDEVAGASAGWASGALYARQYALQLGGDAKAKKETAVLAAQEPTTRERHRQDEEERAG